MTPSPSHSCSDSHPAARPGVHVQNVCHLCSVCDCVCVWSANMTIWIYAWVHWNTHNILSCFLSFSLSAFLSFCLSLCLSVFPSACLSVSVCLSFLRIFIGGVKYRVSRDFFLCWIMFWVQKSWWSKKKNSKCVFSEIMFYWLRTTCFKLVKHLEFEKNACLFIIYYIIYYISIIIFYCYEFNLNQNMWNTDCIRVQISKY